MKSDGRSFFNIEDLKTSLPNGIRHFSDETSFHGFHELYHAKTVFWKFFWFLMCGAACALTGYQVFQAVTQYIQQSTTTLIAPLQETDMLYPPLSLCFWHWFYWVDWKKAKSLNFSTEALLFGFSYYNSIYSAADFDVDRAKDDFTQLMKDNNFSSLSQFYMYVARDVPITADNNKFKSYFKHRQIVYNQPYHMFCYRVSEQQMYNFFAQNQNDDGSVRQKVITFNTYDESYANFSTIFTVTEYNYYMMAWADKFSMYRLIAEKDQSIIDFSKFAPPKILILFSNIEKGADIQAENDAYQIDIGSSVYTWRWKSEKPCLEGEKALASDQSCQDLCLSHYESEDCSCQSLESASRLKKDTMENVCNFGLSFLSGKNGTPSTIQSCSFDLHLTAAYYKCLNSCEHACQIWNYEKTITIKTSSNILRSVGVKSSTTIRIEYPMGKDIINMIETEAQSWEDFIGNVGGLLGIWTGASILSFIQLFYLCFCADCDCESCPGSTLQVENMLKPKKKLTKVIHLNTVKQIDVALKK